MFSLPAGTSLGPVKFIDHHENYIRKFRLHATDFLFKFTNPPTGTNEFDWIRKGLSQIIKKAKADSSPSDYLGFKLESINLKSKEPGYVSFRPAKEISKDVLWQIFGGLLQSNAENIKSTDTFKVTVTRVNVPVGKGRVRPGMYNNFDEECKARKGIVVINNKDNLCLARAIVVAIANVTKDPEYKAIRQDMGQRQTFRAKKLMAKACVDIPEEGAGIPELEKFQAYLKKYKITVYNYDTKGRDVYFCGGNEDAKLRINLLSTTDILM
jgi:hypothetical protein